MDGITDRFVSVSFEPPYDVTECGKCARPREEVPLSWSINTKDRERLLSGMIISPGDPCRLPKEGRMAPVPC